MAFRPQDLDYIKQLRQRDPGRERRPPVAIGGLFDALRPQRLFKASNRVERVASAWRRVVGDEISTASVVKSFRQGELKVVVSSQALAHELGTFRERELVAKLNEALDGKDRVARISFKSGRV